MDQVTLKEIIVTQVNVSTSSINLIETSKWIVINEPSHGQPMVGHSSRGQEEDKLQVKVQASEINLPFAMTKGQRLFSPSTWEDDHYPKQCVISFTFINFCGVIFVSVITNRGVYLYLVELLRTYIHDSRINFTVKAFLLHLVGCNSSSNDSY
ncbi:hypothetical protein CR513_59468, partial [Mucuna pruriens]